MRKDANGGKIVPKGRDLAVESCRKKYSVFGTKELTLEVEADSPQAAAAMMREKGFSPVSVEQLDDAVFVSSWDCIAKCEACGKELLEGDKIVSFLDGPVMCAEHE
jgi:hypothetical protein